MTTVGYGTLQIIPSMKGVQSSLERGFAPVGTSVGRSSGERLATGMRTSLASRARTIFAPLLAAGLAYKAIDFFGDSISQASDLNETLNLTRVIFDQNSKAVIRWSRDSDTALGLSQNSALQATGQFGDMFDQMGFGEQKAVRLSERVVELGADLGSFRNLGTEDVLERIQAGFRGEYDSLQLLVPTISAAAVQQKALAMTGKDSADQLTAQDKAAATLAFVFDKTTKAQGDFARTSDGLANSQKILGAQVDNVQAKIGTALLPIATDLVHFLSREGVPALEDFSDWFSEKGVPALQDGADTAVELGQKALPIVVDAAGTLVDIGQDLLPVLDKGLNLFQELPGPVKDFAFALALVKFSGLDAGLTTIITKGKTFAGTVSTMPAALGRLQSSARSLAGPVGLGLLISSADDTAGSLTSMVDTIGAGALIGFGFGGGAPGALFGAAAGSLVFLGQTLLATGDAAEEAQPPVGDYVDTLNQLTGAATRATRAEVARTLQENDSLTVARELGINTADLVSAVLGRGDAQRRVNGQLKAAAAFEQTYFNRLIASGKGQAEAANLTSAYHRKVAQLTDTFNANRRALDGMSRDQREIAEAVTGNTINLGKYRDALKGIPTEARSQIRLLGTDASKADLKAINDQFKGFSDKDFQAFVKILGLDEANSGLRETKSWLDTIDGRVARSYVINTVTERHLITGTPSATGGTVTGGVPGKDSVPILAMPGEEIIRERVARKHRPFLKALNAEKFADGGTVGGSAGWPSATRSSRVRATFDFGGGRTLEGWIDEIVDARDAHAATMRRQG